MTGRPRRIVVNGRFLLQDVTGVQRVAIEFVRTLDDMLVAGELPGLDVEVVLPRRGRLVTRPDYEAIRVRRAGRLTSHLWEQLELPRLVGDAPLLCLGNLAPVALLLARRDVHTMVHDLSWLWFPDAYSRSFRLLYGLVTPVALSRSRTVFTVSRSERAAILDRFPRLVDPERLVAVQNGGGEGASTTVAADDAAALAPGAATVPTLARRDRRCLYVGSLTHRKNAAGLAAAMVELVRTGDVEAVLVGASGSSFEGTGVAVPEQYADRIHLLGQVNDPAAIEAEYRRASVLLFPSFYEASPLPPVEAMRFGCPVVAADIPSLRERCGDAVLYCDPHDLDSMVGQVRAVLEDPETWRRLQAAGLRRAAGFTWRAQVEHVLAHVLDRVAAS